MFGLHLWPVGWSTGTAPGTIGRLYRDSLRRHIERVEQRPIAHLAGWTWEQGCLQNERELSREL